MSDYDPRTMRGPQVDVDAAVRRGQRRFKVQLAMIWVTVLALTAVLVIAAVLVRAYVHSLRIAWRVSPILPAPAWWLLLAAAVGALLLLRAGRRIGRGAIPTGSGETGESARHHVRAEIGPSVVRVTVYQDPHAAPRPSVRVIPHYSSTVTVHALAG
jgi:hypothetical protein